MSTNNQMKIVGNIATDPKLRYTSNTKPVVNLRVASDEQIQVDGEWKSVAQFVTVVVFGQMAENVSELQVGDRIVVHGRLRQREYKPDGAAGDTQYFTEVVADEVAVSLKWASVEITKNAPKSQSPDALVGAHADPVYGDEEPF